jgi:hypothetical protein
MDEKSKGLLLVLILLSVLSIGFTFWQTVVQQHFQMSEDVPVKE